MFVAKVIKENVKSCRRKEEVKIKVMKISCFWMKIFFFPLIFWLPSLFKRNHLNIIDENRFSIKAIIDNFLEHTTMGLQSQCELSSVFLSLSRVMYHRCQFSFFFQKKFKFRMSPFAKRWKSSFNNITM